MNGTVNLAFVNRKHFGTDKNGKDYLIVDCGNSVGKDQYKKYINYTVSLREEEAVYWNNLITGNKEDKQCVSFSGYIGEVEVSENNGKTYTKIKVNLSKLGKTSAFFLIPNLSEKASGGGQKLDDSDF